ncbi:MAG: phosphotransferase [Thermoanaerobaculia bacterium]|nr:phosphotransferase [Thermoanaerobaculia bacterium]
MTLEQIRSILGNGAFPGRKQPAELVETHISWVILTPDFAFKIKKPVLLGFLDFSTDAKRKMFCEEEVRLNRRLAPDMYLGVLPVGGKGEHLQIAENALPVLDYAVHMRRIDNSREMDVLLEQNRVTAGQMEQLAAVLAAFHRQVVMTGPIVYHPGAHWADFAELYRFQADVEKHFGPAAAEKMNRWRARLPLFLEQNAGRLIARVRDGFWVDGHGDLHARNIFLTEKGPVVFDCIEFSAHFRQSDILNELAFLCMDLEARGHPELANTFLQAYARHWNVFPDPADQGLFRFFKAYRANVRLKVALIELRQHPSVKLEEQVKLYWGLLDSYLRE